MIHWACEVLSKLVVQDLCVHVVLQFCAIVFVARFLCNPRYFEGSWCASPLSCRNWPQYLQRILCFTWQAYKLTGNHSNADSFLLWPVRTKGLFWHEVMNCFCRFSLACHDDILAQSRAKTKASILDSHGRQPSYFIFVNQSLILSLVFWAIVVQVAPIIMQCFRYI